VTAQRPGGKKRKVIQLLSLCRLAGGVNNGRGPSFQECFVAGGQSLDHVGPTDNNLFNLGMQTLLESGRFAILRVPGDRSSKPRSTVFGPLSRPLPDRKSMSRTPETTDITGHLVFLGTGTSVGVPMIGCGCDVCNSQDPKNNRTRCSVILGLPEGTLLIDTPPDLRSQLLREQLGLVHAVLFTHEHADHLFGLDDLRIFQFYLNGAVPLYCEPTVEQRILQSYDYAFAPARSSHAGATPKLSIQTIGTDPLTLLGTRITPIRLHHGTFMVLGFRIGNVAYCTDVNEIPEESWPRLEGLDVLILGALRNRPHPTHFSVQQAIEVHQRLRPKRTLLTHLSHELDHEATNAELPAGVQLAYDGLKVPLT